MKVKTAPKSQKNTVARHTETARLNDWQLLKNGSVFVAPNGMRISRTVALTLAESHELPVGAETLEAEQHAVKLA